MRAAHRDEDEDGAQAAPSPPPVRHQAIAVFRAAGAGRFASFAGRSSLDFGCAKIACALAPRRAPEHPRRRRAPSRSSSVTVSSPHTASSPHAWTSSPSSSPSLPTGRRTKLIWLAPSGKRIQIDVPSNATPGTDIDFEVPRAILDDPAKAALRAEYAKPSVAPWLEARRGKLDATEKYSLAAVREKVAVAAPAVGAGVDKAAYSAWEAAVVAAFYDASHRRTPLKPTDGAPSLLTKRKVILVAVADGAAEAVADGATDGLPAHQHVQLWHVGKQKADGVRFGYAADDGVFKHPACDVGGLTNLRQKVGHAPPLSARRARSCCCRPRRRRARRHRRRPRGRVVVARARRLHAAQGLGRLGLPRECGGGARRDGTGDAPLPRAAARAPRRRHAGRRRRRHRAVPCARLRRRQRRAAREGLRRRRVVLRRLRHLCHAKPVDRKPRERVRRETSRPPTPAEASGGGGGRRPRAGRRGGRPLMADECEEVEAGLASRGGRGGGDGGVAPRLFIPC